MAELQVPNGWKDSSSWSKGERATEPKSVTFKGCDLYVTRHIHYERDDWVMMYRHRTLGVSKGRLADACYTALINVSKMLQMELESVQRGLAEINSPEGKSHG